MKTLQAAVAAIEALISTCREIDDWKEIVGADVDPEDEDDPFCGDFDPLPDAEEALAFLKALASRGQ